VARKLLNLCAVFVLLTGCWGGVLAAVVCPHAGCETTASAAPDLSASGDNQGGHCHDTARSAGESIPDKAHEGHVEELPVHEQQQFGRGELQEVAARSHERSCAHCVGSPETPPTQEVFEQQTNSAKKDRDFAAPHVAARVESPSPVFQRKIAPAQHAPPGRSDKQLLLNVFRI
jgi:hypothetical protein